jgi:hypothetical protein
VKKDVTDPIYWAVALLALLAQPVALSQERSAR